METKNQTVPFKLKSISEEGYFKGYASVFGNIDGGNDIVEQGAFSEFRTNQAGKMRIALHHDVTQIAGLAKVSQDSYGLYFEGQLNLDVSYVKDAHALMKQGALDEMSIGYEILDYEVDTVGGINIWRLKELKLLEISIVAFGMNEQAKIGQVKSIRQCEKYLRDEGMSSSKAKTAVSMIKKALREDGNGTYASDEAAMVSDLIKEIKQNRGNYGKL